MRTLMVAISGMFLLGAATEATNTAPSPIDTFLQAADVNDFSSMQTMMDQKAADFLKKINSCYLRRVYQNPETTAAWMCHEGAEGSRLIIANIGLTKANKITIVSQQEIVSDRFAPPRKVSAFAPNAPTNLFSN